MRHAEGRRKPTESAASGAGEEALADAEESKFFQPEHIVPDRCRALMWNRGRDIAVCSEAPSRSRSVQVVRSLRRAVWESARANSSQDHGEVPRESIAR